ncbi:MAG: YggS family pyridoxal phosphate-dependent enzyme [Ruminococcus sp.]|nr:YggS family pyridoxal phosphate-dependent enzyme [Ruminococcus sp.]
MDNYSFDRVKDNLSVICDNISEAYDKYRSDGSKVDIMAVTKTVPPEVVNWVFSLGLDLLGENRVQEFLSKKDSYNKYSDYGTPPRIHFIGHLQTNKVKYIVDDVDMIQSVDSLRLAQEINRLATAHNKVMDVLCEVNIGGEESKSGVSPDELIPLLEQLAPMEGIRVKGLMTIPPPTDSDIFLGKMEELFNNIKDRKLKGISMETLSMGMTHDYVEAVKHGSTLVRIGTGIFGARNYV